MHEPVREFQGIYRPFSNFWNGKVNDATVEHYFQASKTTDPTQRSASMNAATPGIAKKMGGKVTLRSDWEEIKIPVMAHFVARKFANNTQARNLLISTEHALLQEGNTWGDKFWGVDLNTGEGENHLGTILMAIRATYMQGR
jgi:ribA/ribD-fused uncharacterized protein